jgi:hypothetical protein
MTREDEWGPWLEHDRNGCPKDVTPGVFIEVEQRRRCGSDERKSGRATTAVCKCPQWHMKDEFGEWCLVLRYRVRKPRAMEMLKHIARDAVAPSGLVFA